MLGWLFATVALVCFYRAHRLDSFAIWYPVGLALVVLAFLSKQTYSCCAAVPLFATLVVRPTPLRRHLLFALLPLVCLAGMLAVMKRFAPNLYFYTVAAPRSYPIDAGRLRMGLDMLVMYMPLFPAAVIAGYFIQRGAAEHRIAPKMVWLIVTICIGNAAGLVAFAKPFATFNSLLLGWIPMTMFCCAVVPRLLRRLCEFSLRPLLSIGGIAFVAYLIYVTAFSVGKGQWNWNLAHGSRDYARVVELVKRLKGGAIVCPEDPTIPLFANGYLGRNIETELDASGRKSIPARVVSEISNARWLVRVKAGYPEPRLTDQFLMSLGFRQERDVGRTYSIWLRPRKLPH
jgi:hypothetical protein